MLTNQFIKAHGDLLKGEIDNTVYEKLDIFQDLEIIGELPNVPISSPITNNPLIHICYSEDGNYYYNFSPYDTKDIYIEKRNTQTHEIVTSITTTTGSIRTLIGGYERDGNLYICTHSQHSGGQKDWYFVVDIYDAETLEVINYAYGGSQFQHIGTSSSGTGFKALGTFYHFSKTVDYIFFWNGFSDGSDPAVIRIDYTSIDEDHNAWTHFYSTNAGTGVTTEDAINGIVVENYEDPAQVKLAVRLYYVDGFVEGDWSSDGTAQAYLRVDFKDFDQEEFINESNYKFLDISSLSSGLNDPEDKANGIMFGKNNQSCVFKYNLADLNVDNYTQFYCKINFNDGVNFTTQWWPRNPLDGDGNADTGGFIGLNPTFSKNKDLMFTIGILDGNFQASQNLHLHVIDAKTMGNISVHQITNLPATEPTYDLRSNKGSITFANNDKTILTYTGGRFHQNSGVELVTQTIGIDTDLSVGTDTLGTLNLIEHAYGTSDTPETPNDIKLGNELARKAFLSETLYNNTFIATTQLTTDELNGFTLKEASVQSLNNNMAMRSNIDRYKDENIILDFQSNIRNQGEKNIESDYLNHELTKFYNGNGVVENVKMTRVSIMHNTTEIDSILISDIITIDDVTFKIIIEYTSLVDVTINRFQVLNSQNIVLQDTGFSDKTLLANTRYKFEIIMKGKEVI